jgi:hypothetical protein
MSFTGNVGNKKQQEMQFCKRAWMWRELLEDLNINGKVLLKCIFEIWSERWISIYSSGSRDYWRAFADRNKTPWPESASELYRPSDSGLPAKLVPTFVDRGCDVVSVTDPYSRIHGFLDPSRCFFFQAAPQLYSRGWVDPVRDPLLLRKSGSTGIRTRSSGSVVRNHIHKIYMLSLCFVN